LDYAETAGGELIERRFRLKSRDEGRHRRMEPAAPRR
jgi:hypothetical protein